VRATVRERIATIAGGRTLHTWNDLLSTFPHLLGVKTGHTNGAGWSEVAAARGRGTTVYATILGSPSRGQRNDDLAALLAWGLGQYTVVTAIAPARAYATAHTQYGRGDVRLVASRPLLSVVRVNRPLTQRVVATRVAELPVRKGQRLGEIRVYAGDRLIGSRPLVADRSVAKPGVVGRVRWYATRTADHVWGWVR
jgi:serine-type D-Ala-D-Ala carboxypeptidase (penicillin-binding protein 5/6)